MESGNRGLSGAQNSQEKAFYGGAFIIMTMGFYIAWDSYLGIFANQWYYFGLTSGDIIHAMISWHIAFVIGAAAGIFLMEKFTKKIIYYGSAIVIIISGILMIPSWSDIAPIIVARYIGGLAHGAVFLVTIIHASEVAVPRFRGRSLGAISFYLATSLFIGYMLIGLFDYINSGDFYADQLLACITIVYGVISIVLNRFSCIESPVYYLQKNDTGSALNTLAKLRNDPLNSWSVNTEFGELQTLVNEQRSESICLFGRTNLKPLLRATLLRALYSTCTVIALNIYAYIFLAIDLAQFGLGVVHAARFIAEGAAIYLVDRIGRRSMLAVSSAVAGLMLIIIGGLLFVSSTYTLIITCGVLFIIFSLAYGFGLAPVSVIYMGESFTLRKKPYSILFILCVEQLVHIITFIIIRYAPIDSIALFLSVGILLCIATVVINYATPETKQTSLTECKDRLK